jgi:putative flippase GtrA
MTAPSSAGGLGGLLARARAEYGEKASKYLAVTMVNVVVGQGLLIFCNKVVGLSFVPSNVIAVSVSAVPAFVLYRRWVWAIDGRTQLAREVIPFWIAVLIGLVLSTGAVALADRYSDRTIVLSLTNLTAFGILWVLKFFFLDKFLFKVAEELVHDEAADAVESTT